MTPTAFPSSKSAGSSRNADWKGGLFCSANGRTPGDLMSRAAIYVQPSFWEALGLALQEAMFAGCACVGSRAGGIPELIEENKTGLLFEPGNVAQLAAALEATDRG